jgi:16S rRNA (uracil1498-N3)-methyltransferase
MMPYQKQELNEDLEDTDGVVENMQRYFVRADQILEDRVVLDGDDAHHLIRVMRARLDDKIIVSDGRDREVLAQISNIGKGTVEARIVERLAMDREPVVRVTIAQSLPKGDKFETVIQKGTELGAHKFVPFVSQRTVVQYDERKEAKRLERWRKIAKEAAEQAHRNRVPEVTEAVRWRDIVQQAADYDIAIMCYEKAGSGRGLRPLLHSFRREHMAVSGEREPMIMLIVGPEGGFTEQEVEHAEQAGIRIVGLGSRILRTETAAMVGLACIMYEYNEMGES